jgi:hypothetical protein
MAVCDECFAQAIGSIEEDRKQMDQERKRIDAQLSQSFLEEEV